MNQFKPDELVNVHGQPWTPSAESLAWPAKKAAVGGEFHKGWKVFGLPPGSEDLAKENWSLGLRSAQKTGRTIADFDLPAWLAKMRPIPVRAKPYEVFAAAIQCKELAERYGWVNVEVREINSKVAA